MNFTSDIKKELIAKGMGTATIPAVSAFLRTSGDVGINNGEVAFYFVSETENVAEFFMSAFLETFGVELYVSHATRDKMSGRDKLVLQCPAEASANVAKRLGVIKRTGGLREGIAASLVATEEERLSYIRGAFLGGGSCTVPTEGGRTGYHLEFVFSNRKIAQEFCELLAELELIGKVSKRNQSYVVYIKSKELISDFLSIIGAENSLKRFSALVEKRDKANNDNRARNCIAGNVDKTAIASVKQVVAIQGLQDCGALDLLNEELKATARARLDNPTLSLQELAKQVGVGKSCLNHRMRKLMELAHTIEEKNEKTKETEKL